MKLVSKFFVFSISILLSSLWGCQGAQHQWEYFGDNGPDNWPELFKHSCGGQRQSPIDIWETYLDKSLDDFHFKRYDSDLDKPILINNGHTVQIDSRKFAAEISGGCLNDYTYKMEQLHFHWGSKDKNGSEHLFKGKAYPLELHLVHRNTKYHNLLDALNADDGLAVVAVFFKVSSEDNDKLHPIIHNLDDVRFHGQEEVIKDKGFTLSDLLPKKREWYMCYNGSLTTPHCNEAVTWIIFPEPVPIGHEQLREFRRTYSGKTVSTRPMKDNFRPTQPLNGRKVLLRDPNSASSTSLSLVLAFATLVTIVKSTKF